MMPALKKLFLSLAALVIADICCMADASARGGASNIMNSPGYQRRLQESRGYVTNQSGSIFTPTPAPMPVPHIKKRRHRR